MSKKKEGSMMKYEQLAKGIIENVGGKENAYVVVHCITRRDGNTIAIPKSSNSDHML
jgi:diketogulonate reductase-like aldo/keto reductase